MKLADYLNEALKLPKVLYHATVGEMLYKPGVVYLTPDKRSAAIIGLKPVLVKGREGEPHIYKIKVRSLVQIKDINDAVKNVLTNDNDMNKAVEQEANKARNGGYKFMYFSYANEFKVFVSLYPEDLEIMS
jgi:hypothetical protein